MQKKADQLRDLLRLARMLRTAAGEGSYQDIATQFAQAADALERRAREIAYGQPIFAPARRPVPAPASAPVRAIDLVC